MSPYPWGRLARQEREAKKDRQSADSGTGMRLKIRSPAQTYLTELGCSVDILLDSFENTAVLLEQDAIGPAAAAGDGGGGQVATGREVEVEALHDDRGRSRGAHSEAQSRAS